MKNTAIGMIATTLTVLLSGLSVFFVPFVGGIVVSMHDVLGVALVIANSISVAAHFALANGCCVCIPIPLAFGVFALSQRTKASAVAETFSRPEIDS